MRNPKPLIPQIKNKLVQYVAKEFNVDKDSRIIFLGSKTLNEVEPITRERIKNLEYREGYKVYNQGLLF